MIRRAEESRDPIRPRSRIAIDRSGDEPGAGGRTVGIAADACGQAEGSVAEAAADRAQRRSQDHRRTPRPHRAQDRAAEQPRRPPQLLRPRQPAWRQRRASTPPLPAARKPSPPAAVAATSSTLAGRQGRAGKRHRAGAQAQAGRRDAGRRPRYPIRSRASSPNGSSCAATTTARPSSAIAPSSSANPSWPSQTFLRRRIEAALWDDHRDDATVLVVVRKRIAALGQGQVRAGARRCSRAATAPTPSGWCATPGGSDRCRRTPRAPRSIMFGALLTPGDHKARMDLLLYGSEQEAGGMRAAKRLGRGHVALAKARIAANQKGVQLQGPARRGAARTARRSRLHLRQDPAAAPRGEVCRGRAADAERAARSGPAATISTNGGSSGGCWRARCSTSASTAPPI